VDGLLIAVVGGLVGGALAAVIGGLFALRQQRQQHEHELVMANVARVQARRQRAYEKLLTVAYRIDTAVGRTEPFWGPVPDPPPPIPDEAAFELQALASAYASPPTQETFREVTHAARRFQLAADQVRYARSHLEGQEAIDARQEMDAARVAVQSAIEELGRRMNTELASASASD
jgi:type II secretory pathway pseudopilin PulG